MKRRGEPFTMHPADEEMRGQIVRFAQYLIAQEPREEWSARKGLRSAHRCTCDNCTMATIERLFKEYREQSLPGA